MHPDDGDPDDDEDQRAADEESARQTAASAALAMLRSPAPRREPLYRVVEVVRNGEGRLEKHGPIWHHDLDRVRRFGRAVAANSASQHVVVADANGAVVENIPRIMPGAEPPGWNAWSTQPLPPMPPRPQTRVVPKRLPKPPPPAPRPPRPQPPVVHATPEPKRGPEDNVESTRPLPDNAMIQAARQRAGEDDEGLAPQLP